MSISHSISNDGLKLTSMATINGKHAEVTVTWKDKEKAERNYKRAMNLNETHFKTLDTNSFIDNGKSKNTVKNLFKLGNIHVAGGSFKGNIYDKVRITFGTHSWVADIVAGSTLWKTFRSDPIEKKNRFLVGVGGKTSAIFLSFENKKVMSPKIKTL